MIRPNLAQLRADLFAAFDSDRATWVEDATRRRVDWARHLALDRAELPGRLDARIGHRHRGKQRLGIGMERIIEQLVARREFDDPPEIHDRHAVAEVPDDR